MPRLEGHDIIAFTYADWHASWSTPQQVMSRLAPQNRVLFVDQPRSFLYWLKSRDPQGAGVWEGERLKEVQENLFAYHAPHVFAPVGRIPLALAKASLRVNGLIAARFVMKQMQHLNMKSPILWNFSPLHGKAVSHIPRALTIYDICDEWVNYIDNPSGRQVVRWVEDELTRTAGLVFIGTENGKKLREGMNPEVHVVHHAADYAHFATAALPETKAPEDIAALPKPVVGSVGVMDPARFDVDRIVYIAEARPDWSVALVGPARADMDLTRLKSCPNVYLFGNRDIAELPAYIKGMDVALIPYKVNEATRNIYPLKLQEYLATGKPVVSSAMPAVAPYGEVVAIAETHEACVAEIEAALRKDSPEKRAARQAVARANSWERRVEEKSAHILRLLGPERAMRECTGS